MGRFQKRRFKTIDQLIMEIKKIIEYNDENQNGKCKNKTHSIKGILSSRVRRLLKNFEPDKNQFNTVLDMIVCDQTMSEYYKSYVWSNMAFVELSAHKFGKARWITESLYENTRLPVEICKEIYDFIIS